MATSKKLVYIPEVEPNSWLLWSQQGKSVRLRDYRSGRAVIVRQLTVQDGESLLTADESMMHIQSGYNTVRVNRDSVWHSILHGFNRQYGLNGDKEKASLQATFKYETYGLLLEGAVKELKAIINGWIERFDRVTEKSGSFNRFDNEEIAPPFDLQKGDGWQKQMLYNSRTSAGPEYIDTKRKDFDFSLAAMELHLTLSAKDFINPFFPGSRSSINPDGLGIRRNGRFTVLEVKGPQDEWDLLGPALQAACAAVAVYAKREMLCQIAAQRVGGRPGYEKAKIPPTPASARIGIHVVTSKEKTKAPNGRLDLWSETTERACQTLLKSFPHLAYIAYSFVSLKKAANLKSIPIDKLVTR